MHTAANQSHDKSLKVFSTYPEFTIEAFLLLIRPNETLFRPRRARADWYITRALLKLVNIGVKTRKKIFKELHR